MLVETNWWYVLYNLSKEPYEIGPFTPGECEQKGFSFSADAFASLRFLAIDGASATGEILVHPRQSVRTTLFLDGTKKPASADLNPREEVRYILGEHDWLEICLLKSEINPNNNKFKVELVREPYGI